MTSYISNPTAVNLPPGVTLYTWRINAHTAQRRQQCLTSTIDPICNPAFLKLNGRRSIWLIGVSVRSIRYSNPSLDCAALIPLACAKRCQHAALLSRAPPLWISIEPAVRGSVSTPISLLSLKLYDGD